MKKSFRALAAALCLSAGTMASAQDWSIGIGGDGVYSSEVQRAASLELLWHGGPRGTVAGFDWGWGAGLEADADGDVWIGAGIEARRDFGALRVSLSLMPGLYENGRAATDLGGPVEIRSRLGLSLPAGPGRIGMSYAHLSNGGLYDDNPGKNAVYLTYGWAY